MVFFAFYMWASFAAFYMGKFHERKEWNLLIENGKIPAPDQGKADANYKARTRML